MKIKLTRDVSHDGRQYLPGAVADMDDETSRAFIGAGIAEPFISTKAPKATIENKAASAPLAGSPTGQDAPASSSGAAQAPRKRQSRKAKPV